VDTDGDGVADADDAFPNDATETVDTDGDGIGDNADEYPSDATNTPPGTTFELTTAANVLEGGAGDDTFTATNTTLTNADTIRGGDGDADTLNLTSAAAPASAASIEGVEVINVVSTSLSGITAFDATDTTGATINVSIDRFGNDGTVTIANVEGNAVVAGADVDDLTLTNVGTTSVDAGAATTLTLSTQSATSGGRTVTITANDDITAELTSTNAAGDTFVINGAVEVDLVGSTIGTSDTFTAADATIASAELATGATMTAAVAVVDVATAVDVAEWTVGDIQMSVAGGFDINNAQNDSSYTVNLAQTAVTEIDGEAGQTGAVTINTAFDLTGVTTTIFTDTVINVSDDVSLGTVTATDTVTLTGAGDVTVGNTATATTLDASGLTGDLTLTANGSIVDVLGSTGDTTYTTIAAANTFIGQGGEDDVTTGTLTARMAAQMGGGDDTLTLAVTGAGTSVVTADMGAGDDTIEFGAYDDTLIADGGDGSDTLLITTGDNLAAQTVTLTNIENISVQDAAGSAVVNQTMTLNATQAGSVGAISILAPTNGAASDDTLAVTVTSTGATETSIDLSGLTIDADTTSFTINGQDAVTTTIVGSSGDDSIDAGTAATSITGGAGDNTFVFAASDSTEASMASITDYTGAAAAGDNDTLDIVTTTIRADGTTDVSAAAAFATTTGTVNFIVADGVGALSGLAADVALVDTLAKYLDVLEVAGAVITDNDDNVVDSAVVAFEFSGNTYVATVADDGNNDGASANTVTDVIELAGVTGLDLATAAAADTILIA
jgi:hypothetical protein